MACQTEKAPRGPLGTQGHTVSPGQLQVGDMIGLDGVFHVIEDMQSGRGGQKLLRFADREPFTVAAPVLVYRAIVYTPVLGEMVYSRSST